MRVHSAALTMQHIADAARYAGVTVQTLTEHRSTTRPRAFDFYVSGHGVTGGQWGQMPPGVKSACWDEWGILINQLYLTDPAAHFGKNSYQSAEHFHWVTGGRFKSLQPSDIHVRHRWDDYEPLVRGGANQARCRCGATIRHIYGGYTWDQDREELMAVIREAA